MQHFKPTCAIELGEVTAFVPEEKLFQKVRSKRRLSPTIWADLAVIAVANDQGFPDIGETVLRGLEARFGVTEHDRVAALVGSGQIAGAFIPLADALERKERLQGAIIERGARRALPALRAKVRTDAVLREAALLRTVDLREAELRTAKGKNAIRRAREALRRAVHALTEHCNQTWGDAAVEESAGLARARGEEVSEVNTVVSDWVRDPITGALLRDAKTKMPVLKTELATTRRVKSRTGLAKAFEDGVLDQSCVCAEKLYQAGKNYRDAYEVAEGRVSPSRDLGLPSSPRCKPSPGLAGVTLAAAESLAQMRGTKLTGTEGAAFRLTPTQRKVLDAICGEDHAISAAADRLGRSRPTTRNALVSGLETVCANLGWE